MSVNSVQPYSMSRAFVRETDADVLDTLPDRAISPHPNFVTMSGLAKIDARVHELTEQREAALAADDTATVASVERELRYWKQRRSSARMIAAPATPEIVRFGVTVELQFEDGGRKQFRLVGEDEADPSCGLLSWTSPLGTSLIGRRLGDSAEVLGRRAEIVAMTA
jgi:transcription elongation GreA/GreB family factor